MFVSEKKAKAAAEVFGIALDEITVANIADYYRGAAKATHPDAGGTAEAFAKVQWAHGVLRHWLTRPPAPERAVGAPCTVCNGRGRIRVQRGFSAMPRTCPSCRGTGYSST